MIAISGRFWYTWRQGSDEAHSKGRDDGLSQWVNALAARKHVNAAAVALANKTARFAWAITTKNVEYDPALSALSTTQQ